MTKLELSPDGYERIMAKIQAVEDALDEGAFDSDAALRCLWTAGGKLYELRRTINGVCLLVPDAAGPPGPGAA
jgi:hypothetical protein